MLAGYTKTKQLILFLIGLFACTSVTLAATIQVTSSNDTGANTFRAAVATANTNPDTDIINFAVAGPITVQSTITVSYPVIIQGNGTTLNSIGGLLSGTVLSLASGSNGSRVSGLAIVNGMGGIDVASNGNSIFACVIGTDWADAVGRGNTRGASVTGNANIIGPDNVISGNYAFGISMSGNYNQIQGNRIGLNRAGLSAVYHTSFGLSVSGTNNWIGGGLPANRNLVAGNALGLNVGGNSNWVQGNYFSFNQTGDAVIANTSEDLEVTSSFNQIRNNYFGKGISLSITANSNTITANVGGLFPNGSGFTGKTLQSFVSLSSGPSGNFIGLPGGPGNLMADTQSSAIAVNASSSLQNGFFANTMVACAALPISLQGGANNNQPAPVIGSARATGPVIGTARANEYIELFLAEGSGTNAGCLSLLASTYADSGGAWQFASLPVSYGDYVVAIATDSQNNSSQLSAKALVMIPTPTFTATPTATNTATPTITRTATPTGTSTATPTLTPSATITPTPSISATATISPTRTCSPAISPTCTASPTFTPTATASLTFTPGFTFSGVVLAFPNPARDRVFFLFNTGAAEVDVVIYNAAGERIAKVSGPGSSSSQPLMWDCGAVAPGVYLARIMADNHELRKIKLAIVR